MLVEYPNWNFNQLNQEKSMSDQNTERRGHLIATSIWNFLERQKSVKLVPWVAELTSPRYDPEKVAHMAGYKQALEDIRQIVIEETERLKT
jgi:hypothetical protein